MLYTPDQWAALDFVGRDVMKIDEQK